MPTDYPAGIPDLPTNRVAEVEFDGDCAQDFERLVTNVVAIATKLGVPANPASGSIFARMLAVEGASAPEAIQDIVGAFVQGSGGITATYNDAANSLTLDASTLQALVTALTGYTVLVSGLTGTSPSYTGNTTASRSTLKAVAPTGTTGTVLVTQGSLSYTLTINGPAVAVALASGASTTFSGSISGNGNVGVVGA